MHVITILAIPSSSAWIPGWRVDLVCNHTRSCSRSAKKWRVVDVGNCATSEPASQDRCLYWVRGIAIRPFNPIIYIFIRIAKASAVRAFALVSMTLLIPLIIRLSSGSLRCCTWRRETTATGMPRPRPQGYRRLLEFEEWGSGKRLLVQCQRVALKHVSLNKIRSWIALTSSNWCCTSYKTYKRNRLPQRMHEPRLKLNWVSTIFVCRPPDIDRISQFVTLVTAASAPISPQSQY